MEKRLTRPGGILTSLVQRLGLPVAGLFFLMFMTISSSAAQTITAHDDVSLTAATTDFNAGEKQSMNNTIDWTSDTDWTITVRSLDADLGQSDDLSYTKSLSDLQWKLSAGGSWVAMTTADVTVKTGVTGGGSFDVDYKFLLAWASDKPGTYSATLEFTITTP